MVLVDGRSFFHDTVLVETIRKLLAHRCMPFLGVVRCSICDFTVETLPMLSSPAVPRSVFHDLVVHVDVPVNFRDRPLVAFFPGEVL